MSKPPRSQQLRRAECNEFACVRLFVIPLAHQYLDVLIYANEMRCRLVSARGFTNEWVGSAARLINNDQLLLVCHGSLKRE